MRRWLQAVLALILGLGLASSATGTTLLQTDLAGLTRAAHRIFSGRVVSAEPGTVTVGGGELPVIHYIVEVDDALKGDFDEVKGHRVARLTMLGKLTRDPGTGIQRGSVIPGLPRLHPGERVFLFTTRPGVTGLSATVGLEQGCFRIAGESGRETAVNGFNNRGLLHRRPTAATESSRAGSDSDGATVTAGPVPLADLVARVRAQIASRPGRP